MTQNNIYMEDDSKGISVDVEPLFLDLLTQNKDIALESANIAQECEQSVSSILESVLNAKRNIEFFCAQTTNRLTELQNEFRNAATNVQNTILNNINTFTQQNINSIRVEGQSAVNQIQECAERLENTVNDNVSLDYLNQSKALKTGNVSTNIKVLPFIKNYAHSTFDASKFTKVGSPIVTSDGIASGFSGVNYIQAASFDRTKPFEIILPIKTPNDFSKTNALIAGSNSGFNCGFVIQINIDGRLKMFASTNGENWNFAGGAIGQTILSVDTNYYIAFSWTGTTYSLRKSTDKKNWTTEWSANSSDALATSIDQLINIGTNNNPSSYSTDAYAGSIDLKQFSITVDGVPVFSGNKTGIDTIKPDDYTVVGTPSISDDGIASGFSATSVIQSNYSFNNASTANSWEVYVKLKTGSRVDDNQNFFANSGSHYTNFRLVSGKLKIEIGGGSSFLFALIGIATLQANTVYYVKFVFTGTKYQIWLSTDGITYTLDNEGNSTDKFVSQGTWGIGSSYNMGQFAFPFLGSIDLNAFKIYVDGSLVYQPCLKIPYTESKTGSKIVNSIYRDRVADMAEQFGYAPYYTLDEYNGNFTLPMGEIYGMIQQLRTTIES